MANSKKIEIKEPSKKVWSKPKLLSGKEIGFFGLGRIQSSTGTGIDPS
ncbi:hypothetical protein [Williamwhitmania taraxaci]|uniref:Uncharacterized protein n=1 Tax=Williamwhitmania taraxaci TaxID=1640674 RepID=A0A1G6T514_9BACT|nr:hypothetical protein [Williamwhitmania taraxaci]SDD23626.1 hypothetical protein SAMN05216323_11114 [Williamwhitmania taraxaci]